MTTTPHPNPTTTLYHNPNCSKSRGALELLQRLAAENHFNLQVVEYLQTPLSAQTLSELLQLLPEPAAALVRKDKNFAALELNDSDYQQPARIVELLQQHPQLMQRPVAVYNGRAAIGRPPEDLLGLFE